MNTASFTVSIFSGSKIQYEDQFFFQVDSIEQTVVSHAGPVNGAKVTFQTFDIRTCIWIIRKYWIFVFLDPGIKLLGRISFTMSRMKISALGAIIRT
jgi:hypothetical protein